MVCTYIFTNVKTISAEMTYVHGDFKPHWINTNIFDSPEITTEMQSLHNWFSKSWMPTEQMTILWARWDYLFYNRMSSLDPNCVRLAPNGTNLRLFEICFHFILAHRAEMYWKLILKIPRFVPFVAKLFFFHHNYVDTDSSLDS